MLTRALRAWSPGGHRGRVLASEAPVSRGPSAVRTVRTGGTGAEVPAEGSYGLDWSEWDFVGGNYETPAWVMGFTSLPAGFVGTGQLELEILFVADPPRSTTFSTSFLEIPTPFPSGPSQIYSLTGGPFSDHQVVASPTFDVDTSSSGDGHIYLWNYTSYPGGTPTIDQISTYTANLLLS